MVPTFQTICIHFHHMRITPNAASNHGFSCVITTIAYAALSSRCKKPGMLDWRIAQLPSTSSWMHFEDICSCKHIQESSSLLSSTCACLLTSALGKPNQRWTHAVFFGFRWNAKHCCSNIRPTALTCACPWEFVDCTCTGSLLQ